MNTLNIDHPLVEPESLASLPGAIHTIFEHFEPRVAERVVAGGLPESAVGFHDLEVDLVRLGGELAAQIAASVLACLHRAAPARAAVGQVVRKRSCREVAHRFARVRFLGGLHLRFETPYCVLDRRHPRGRRRKVGRRGKSGTGTYPVLAAFGVIAGATPALAAETARLTAQLSSFREAERDLAARGVPMDVKTVRRISRRFATIAIQKRDERLRQHQEGTLQAGQDFAGKRVVMAFDGGRVRTRVSGKRGRRRAKTGRRGFHTPWREPKLMVLYAIGEDGEKLPEPPVYVATLENWDHAFKLFAAEAHRRGVTAAREVILAGDGSHSIWDRTAWLVQALGLDPSRVVEVVDFYHGAQKVHEVADACKGWSERKRSVWSNAVKQNLRKGRVDRVVETIEALCRGRRGKMVRTLQGYFENNRDRMRYREFERRGIPIGTGAVESGIRRVVNLRLKGAGIFWEVPNAERMLILRTQVKAERWSEFVRDVLGNGEPAELTALRGILRAA